MSSMDGDYEETEAAAAGGDEEKEQDASKKAEAAPGGGDEKEEEKAEVAKVKTKKHLCKYWRDGHCDRGEWCGWAHGKEEIGQQVQDPQELKILLCKFFSAGTCRKKSEECEFAHGEQELGKKKPAVPANQKKAGKEGKGGKEGKRKAGGKMKNTDRPGERKRSRARRSNSKGSRARRSDSRSQVLPIIIQTCSLSPLHQDKTSSAK